LAEGDFAGRLHVDVRQLNAVCDGHAADWTKRHDACLLLTHHPVEWLNGDAQKHFAGEIHHPPERFALHQFGHMHEGGLTSLGHGGGDARRRFQASSLFGLEGWGEQKAKRAHGYALCELKAEDGELRLRIWPRVAVDKQGGGRKLERDSSFDLDERDGGTKSVVVKRMSAADRSGVPQAVVVPQPATATERYDPRNPPFYVPYRQKGDQVIGRDDALVKVRQQLTAGRRTAIGQTAVFEGLGGLGKTQLAVEYAYLHRSDYPNGVIWLTADQDIDSQLVDLAVKARWVAPGSEHSVKLEIARHRLRSYSDCLIVFDNLEQMAAIQDYLPEPPAAPHVLATSRTEQPDFNYVPIEVLDPDQSLRLLVQEAGRQPESAVDGEAARDIAKSLGGLPLALELAGAYLARRPVSWQEYRDLLRYNLKKALSPRLASLTGHNADLYSTLQISEQVFAEEPRLREVVDVLTWSAAAPMGLDLLASLLGIEDRAELTGALGLGTALRILQPTPASDGYGIHRLVREVRRGEVALVGREIWAAKVCGRIADWFDARRQDFAQLARFEAEIDHLREWHGHALQFASRQASRLTWLQAYPAFHRGQPQEIRWHIELALDEYRQYGCDDRALLAHLYNDLGCALGFLGEPQRGQELVEHALAIRRELFGERHFDTAMSLNNVSGCYKDLGDTQRALELAEQALAIRRELFGERHRDSATSLDNIAECCYKLGKPRRALELGEQVLVIRRELFGELHPDSAASLNDIARYYYALGEPQRALDLTEQALAIRRELFGERHPNTATSLDNIAYYCRALRRPERGLELAEQALAIRRELFGERHPYIADSLHSIAGHLLGLGKARQAHARASEALAIRKQRLGANHPDTLNTANLLRNMPGFRAPSSRRPQAKKNRRK